MQFGGTASGLVNMHNKLQQLVISVELSRLATVFIFSTNLNALLTGLQHIGIPPCTAVYHEYSNQRHRKDGFLLIPLRTIDSRNKRLYYIHEHIIFRFRRNLAKLS
jgi:hypothetical protein